jgi:hypothetical protein
MADNGNLVFSRSDVVTFPGKINGSGTLTKKGLGTVILTSLFGSEALLCGVLENAQQIKIAGQLSSHSSVTESFAFRA